MPKEHARNTCKECTDGEREYLVLRRVHPHRLRRNLVLANREARAAVARVHKILDDKEGDEHQAEDPGKIRVVGDALEARCTADIGDVDDDDADNLAETERCDGEVVAAQTQRRQTDECTEESCRDTARENGDGECHLKIRREHDADVRADRHKSGMSERELSRIPVDEVEARREDDVDARKDKVELPERTQHPRTRQPHDDAVDHEGEDEHFEIVFLQ